MRQRILYTFTAIIMLAMLILILSPYFIGFLVQNHFNRMIHDINRHFPQPVRVIAYHHGWLVSEADLEWPLTLAESTQYGAVQSPIFLQLHLQMQQGPYFRNSKQFSHWGIALINFKANLIQTQKPLLETLYRDQPPLQGDIRWAWKTLQGQVDILPFNRSLPSDTQADWKGAQATFNHTPQETLKISIHSAPLSYEKNSFGLKIGQFEADLNYPHFNAGQVWQGSENVVLDQVQLKKVGQIVFLLNNFRFTKNMKIESEFLNMEIGAHLSDLQYLGKSYAPLNWQLHFEHISVPAIDQWFSKFFEQWPNISTEQQLPFIFYTLQHSPFLSPGVQVQNQLNWQTVFGDLQSSFQLKVAPGTQLPAPGSIAWQLNLQIKPSLLTFLWEEYAVLMQRQTNTVPSTDDFLHLIRWMEKEGYLTLEQGDLNTILRYQQGQLLVNDRHWQGLGKPSQAQRGPLVLKRP